MTSEPSAVSIVIHAGMPKGGSSTIQAWLDESRDWLQERGLTVAHAVRDESGRLAFDRYEGRGINSGWIFDGAPKLPAAEQDALAREFVGALRSAVEAHGRIVVSGEALAIPFVGGHEPTLAGLQRLSADVDVRVAYYARPQHTALEAFWRQWGFRLPAAPSAWIERTAVQMHYAATRTGVRSIAPGLDFEPRPLREDMLDRGDLIADFAGRFLGLAVEPAGYRRNPGLPLHVVNLLREAPAGMFWDSQHDNARLNMIKDALGSGGDLEDGRLERSRLVLRKYAHGRFAAENTALGWGDFVEPVAEADDLPGLEALDTLWAPRASPAEREALFRSLQALIDAR